MSPTFLGPMGLLAVALAGVAWLSARKWTAGKATMVFFLLLWYSISWTAIIILVPLETVGGIGRENQLRIHGLLVGALLALFAFLVAVRHLVAGKTGAFRLAEFEKLMLLFFVGASGYGLVIGLLRGDDLGYLVGDTYNMLIIPSAWFIVRGTTTKAESGAIFVMLVVSLVAAEALEGIYYPLEILKRGVFRPPTLYWVDKILLMIILGMFLADRKNKRYESALITGSLLLVAFTSLVSLFRTIWMMVPVVLLGVYLLSSNRFRAVRAYARVALLGAVLMLPGVWAITHTGYGQSLENVSVELVKRFSALAGEVSGTEAAPGSLTTKFIETGDVLRHIRREGDLFAVLMGFGSGAVFQSVTYAPGFERYFKQGFLVHHIHNLFLAFLFRYGVLGAVLFCAFLISLFGMQWRLMVQNRQAKDPLARAFVKSTLIYLFVTLVIINFFSFFYRDLVWGVLLGLSGIYRVEALSEASQRSYEMAGGGPPNTAEGEAK